MNELSIIIPSYNDGQNVIKLINQLNEKNIHCQITIVESANKDYFDKLNDYKNIKTIFGEKGRAKQLNKGAFLSTGNIFLFLHADSDISNIDLDVLKNMDKNTWGCFKLSFDSSKLYFRIIEFTSNIRAKILNLVFGDQAMFITKNLFNDVGGFNENLPFEDLYISLKLKKMMKNKIIDQKIITSSRRFYEHGIIYTHFVMFFIVLTYLIGFTNFSLKLYKLIK